MFRFNARMFVPDNEQLMRGKTVIITGANSGIGLATASELAKYGAKVVMACRSVERAEAARKTIIDELRGKPNQEDIESRLVVKKVDLASLKSVREFADEIAKSESRLDVLINNAGLAGYLERTLTEDGLEATMASNHFGHFLLTNLLLPLLKKTGQPGSPARVIVVSSSVHKMEGPLDLDNLNSEKSYSKMRIYNTTKAVNILFCRHLAKLLNGSNVITNALAPGFVDTDVFRSMPKWAKFVFKPLWLLAKTPIQGAQTTVYLAASQSPEVLVNGFYFDNVQIEECSNNVKDEQTASRLWEISEKLTGLKPDEEKLSEGNE